MKRLLLALAVIAALLAIPQAAINGAAPATAAACANEIACENLLPGTDPEIWDISGSGDDSIQGFATEISVNRGEQIDFKIKTDASAYTIKIYRTGYYQGLGARFVDDVSPTVPQRQPVCATDLTTDRLDCANWAVSASWNVPAAAVSGVYLAVLNRAGGGASHITFIVRDDASHSDLVFQTSDTTWQAYNRYGADYYGGGTKGSPSRAYSISYNRPMVTRSAVPWGRDYYFANEFPLVRFLERNGYDVSYIAGPDTDRHGDLLTNHKTFLSVGHDEYWSGPQRANVEAARDAGVNLMFLSGNEMYWRVRWQDDHRTMTGYKETWEYSKVDQSSSEWTGTFRDPRYAPQSAGAGLPENAVTGTMFKANRANKPITVDAREGRLRLWRHTDLASLPAGESRALTDFTVGYEADEDVDNGFRPPGLIRLSTTVDPLSEYVPGFGNIEFVVQNVPTTHHLTLYRAASGALVFGAGTVQWTWGLDEVHDAPDPGAPTPDSRMQQAQVNLLADMGAQPTTLMAGLTQASASTDTARPTVSITTPTGPRANGSRVTIEGTAQDAGGGQVAGVEVSTDGGLTWHPATGTSNWSYTYTQHGYDARGVWVRAIDDSANIGPKRTQFPEVSCPCSIFGGEVPPIPAYNDPSGYELGLRFTPTRDGQVTGVRFYKGPGNGGTHVGRLWNVAGGLPLAEATFTSETATGWQEVTFASPVTVTQDQSYVVSYSAPQGNYPLDYDAFELRGVEAHPLSVSGGFAAGPGPSFFGAPGTFPSQEPSGRGQRTANYYVDVLFQASGPPDSAPTLDVTDRQPAPGATGVPITAAVSVGFSAPVEPGSSFTLRQGATPLTGSVATSNGGRTLTLTPASPLPPQTQVTADLAGVTSTDGIDLDPLTWTFTTASTTPAPGNLGGPGGPGGPDGPSGPSGPPNPGEPTSRKSATLFGNKTPHGKPTDSRGTEVGVEFTPTKAGVVTAVRYFQVRGRVAPKSVTLWSAKGKRIEREKVSTKSAKPKKTGWRTIRLDDAITVRAGRSYVASYYLPAGRAARTPNFYQKKIWKSGPLTAKRSENGRYVIASKSTFPKRLAPGVNFYADVLFEY